MSKKYKNKICFNDWASYNAGRLNIKWFKAGTKAAEVIEFLTARSPSHDLEIFVADTSLNWPEEIDSPPEIISEHCGLDDALNILELFDAASNDDLKAAAFLLYEGIAEEFEEALTMTDDVNIIECNSGMMSREEELGYYFVENGCFDVPEHIENYFDYEKLGRELLFDNYTKFAGDIYEYFN
tara:strand:- start:118 stop:666 length:549 start_codon:yes stop_codon:yes gene_type:complete